MTLLILYSKPGCHLCEGLEEKLRALQHPPFSVALEVEIRDITQNEAWFQAYQYEIPVLCTLAGVPDSDCAQQVQLPRPSPRLSVAQLQRFLRKHLSSISGGWD